MDSLSNEFIQEILYNIRQKLGSLSDLGPSENIERAVLDEVKEELYIVYDTLSELKKDCEQILSISELLFENKTKMEFESGSMENMAEHIQKIEEESERLKDYSTALETEIENYKTDMEQLEGENNTLDKERENLKIEVRKLKSSLEGKEQSLKEIESTLYDCKESFKSELARVEAKASHLEVSLEKSNKEFKDIQRQNEQLSNTLIIKQREIGSLNDELKRKALEKARLDELNTDLKLSLESTTQELEEREQEIEEIRTANVSNPSTIKM